MFCYTLLYVHSSNHLDGEERELVALLNVYSWCLLMVGWLFLMMPWGCLWFVIVVFPDHTHLLFSINGSLIRDFVIHKIDRNVIFISINQYHICDQLSILSAFNYVQSYRGLCYSTNLMENVILISINQFHICNRLSIH